MTTEILSDEALAEIEARADAATPGPWVIVESALPDDWGVTEEKLGTERKGLFRRKPRHQSIAQMLWEEDAPFVAHARTDIPALCQTVRALRDQLQEEQRRNQTQADSIMDLEAENTTLREQLAEAQKQIEKQDAIISAYENNDEEALVEAERL